MKHSTSSWQVSQLLALVLVGNFNLPDICWKYNTAERKQSRRFLECVEENFLMQLVSEPTGGGASLDLLFKTEDWWELWRSEAVLVLATT